MFMDCQGIADNMRGSKELDNLILFLGAKMANVQIINVKSQLRSDDLKSLEVI